MSREPRPSAYTLDRTMSDQRNLTQLCGDRDLRTREIFAGNAFYGIDAILKEYAGHDGNRPLKVVVPHGFVLDDAAKPWISERTTLLPVVYCYQESRIPAYRRFTRKLVLPAASPFAYLCDLMAGTSSAQRDGTLFFVGHSTHFVSAHADLERLADNVCRSGPDGRPVTVCMYWKDVLMNRHRAFERRGLRVVSAGHMYDPAFLPRLYHLCAQHRYAASNTIGSHLFNSVLAGCLFHYVPSHEPRYRGSNPDLRRDFVPVRGRYEDLRQRFGVIGDASGAEQRTFVEANAGVAHKLDRDGLLRQLEFAEKLDRGGFAREPVSGRRVVQLPRAWLRSIQSGVRAIRGTGGTAAARPSSP